MEGWRTRSVPRPALRRETGLSRVWGLVSGRPRDGVCRLPQQIHQQPHAVSVPPLER